MSKNNWWSQSLDYKGHMIKEGTWIGLKRQLERKDGNLSSTSLMTSTQGIRASRESKQTCGEWQLEERFKVCTERSSECVEEAITVQTFFQQKWCWGERPNQAQRLQYRDFPAMHRISEKRYSGSVEWVTERPAGTKERTSLETCSCQAEWAGGKSARAKGA